MQNIKIYDRKWHSCVEPHKLTGWMVRRYQRGYKYKYTKNNFVAPEFISNYSNNKRRRRRHGKNNFRRTAMPNVVHGANGSHGSRDRWERTWEKSENKNIESHHVAFGVSSTHRFSEFCHVYSRIRRRRRRHDIHLCTCTTLLHRWMADIKSSEK